MEKCRRGFHTFLTTPWWSVGQAMPQMTGLQVNETATGSSRRPS